jgi:hypothetical protein
MNADQLIPFRMKEHNGTEHKLTFMRPVDVKNRRVDIGGFFSSMPVILLFVLMLISYALVVGVGIFMGYERFLKGAPEIASPTDTEVGAVLGLLAFLLGFAFSATWTKFANRSNYVVQHAKAIRTCYLRTSLLPDRQKLESRKLIYEYTAVVLGFYAAPEKSLIKMDALHLLIWQQTATLVQEEMDGELRSLFTGSVNDLINVAMERKAIALLFPIPNIIWGALLFLAVIGMFAFGYDAGINGMRNLFQLFLLPLAFGLVIVLIARLNSSHVHRHFKITQKPLREVLQMMDNFESMAVE